jgi:hypothetical protein
MPSAYREFNKLDRARLEKRLPEAMIDMLEQDNFSSFHSQTLWLCDPDEMKSVNDSWLPQFPKAEIFLRTALGDFFFWDGQMCWICLVHDAQILRSSANITWFMADIITDTGFFRSLGLPKFSNLGRKQLGSLESDQVYFFTPAIGLGGNMASSKIEKGNLAVTLDILSQMNEISIQSPQAV